MSNNEKKIDSAAFCTKGFVKSYEKLRKNVQLRELYPSEAWSVYRIIPQCKTMLDIGCGNGNISSILHAINNDIKYTGIDVSENIIEVAKETNESDLVEFFVSDAQKFLSGLDSKFDCVMCFAATYAFPEFYKVMESMLNASKRFVIFDMRVHEKDMHVADVEIACTKHDNLKSPYVILSFREFLKVVSGWKEKVARVEISGYDFPVNRETHFLSPALNEPAIMSVVLEKRTSKDQADEIDWFIKVPPRLMKIADEVIL